MPADAGVLVLSRSLCMVRNAKPCGDVQYGLPMSTMVRLQAERHALEACVLEMAGKSAALERWLADNEKKAVTGEALVSISDVSLGTTLGSCISLPSFTPAPG